ncbi:MAG: response regulator [Nitrospirales bacterium]|nr:response regulator transcription factor [Nitrospirales bacterium]
MKHFIRIVIVDDHKLVLQGLRALLKEQFHILGEFQNGNEAIQASITLQPEVLLLDISLQPVNGFVIAETLKQRLPFMKIVFVTMHTEPTFVMKAFKVGAAGYVLKHNAASELVDAINTVMKNGYYLSKNISQEVRGTVLQQIEGIPCQSLKGELTARQREVLGFLAQGVTAKDIGKQLGISHSTVAFHTTNIMQALGLKSRAELTKYAMDQNILEDGF